MLTEKDIEKFYQDYKKLGLKKAVATIARATGYGSPNVSEWLSKKKVPSETFIKKFYEAFYKTSTPDQDPALQEAPAGYKTRQDTILYNLSESIRAQADVRYSDQKAGNCSGY